MGGFFGRLQHAFSVTAPYKSFHADSTVNKYRDETKALFKERADEKGDAMLTQAEFDDFKHKKTVLASCMSPDTEEPINWLSRISAFVPTNVPIIACMLMTAPTAKNILLWQWVN